MNEYHVITIDDAYFIQSYHVKNLVYLLVY